MKCDCRAYFQEKKVDFDGIETDAMVCTKCEFTTLTQEQAQRFVRLKQLHQVIDGERKIIKIGNSMGFTLPESIKELGVKVGKKVQTKAVGPNTFEVEI